MTLLRHSMKDGPGMVEFSLKKVIQPLLSWQLKLLKSLVVTLLYYSNRNPAYPIQKKVIAVIAIVIIFSKKKKKSTAPILLTAILKR